MSKLKELLEKREQVAGEAQNLLDQSQAADLTEERAAELEAQADKAFAEFDKLTGQIEREEKRERVVAALDAQRSAPDETRRPATGSGDPVADDDAPTYRDAFRDYLANAGNVAAMTPELRNALGEIRAQTAGTNSQGGYTVPTEMANIIQTAMAMHGPMYDPGVTFEMPTGTGATVTIPTVDDTASTAGASAGEGVTETDDGGKDVAFGSKSLEAYLFTTEWLRISLELATDSDFDIEDVIGRLLGERLGKIANLQLTTGSGSSAPNGIVTASTAGKTAAATAAVTWDECLDLEHSVDPAYRSSPMARYMFNDSTLLALRKLKDGDGNYLWQSGNVRAGVPPTFNGHNYSINQAMASLATGNRTILFGDFSKYFVRKVGAPEVMAMQDKDFAPGFGMMGYIRFDGELTDTAAVKHLVMA